MPAKRIILTGLFVTGCVCLAEYSGSIMAGDNSTVTEIKEGEIFKDKTGNPVIGHLKKKDKVITISKGPDGPLYSVKTRGGRILALNLPAEKLYAEFPELKNVIERGFAVEDAAYRPDKM